MVPSHRMRLLEKVSKRDRVCVREREKLNRLPDLCDFNNTTLSKTDFPGRAQAFLVTGLSLTPSVPRASLDPGCCHAEVEPLAG